MGEELNRFVDIVSRLRGPGGCPWDREQDHQSLLSCLLDEAYEFIEAVDTGDPEKMKEELGDLLLQVGLHAQIAKEDGSFDIENVAREINEKLIRRHPHVFGDTQVASSQEVISNWEKIKKSEKGKEHRRSYVDDIPVNLPQLFRAEKIQRRVARVGFDWDNVEPVWAKVHEELEEFRQAAAEGNAELAEAELGDVLFALVNLARHSGICAEDALRGTNRKFIRRFRYIEKQLTAQGRKLQDATLEEMDALWEESKRRE